jgi:ABC-type microcin C transport system duplicated ATPase subunit YejF
MNLAVTKMETTVSPPLLSVTDLRVAFRQGQDWVPAVAGVSFEIAKGGSFALVGESGSGKSVTALSVMRLLPQNAQLQGGRVSLNGNDVFSLPERDMSSIRGGKIGIVFQDPMTSLNPVLTLGRQIGESLELHRGLKGGKLRRAAKELFEQVGLPNPDRHLEEYPHQLSGGMRQRAMIALALAGEPELLIADEPTTALDVTLQAQILELLRRLRKETGMALWLITHDFGTVAEVADRIAVMRGGVLVETSGPEFFDGPQHPYSRALLNAMPRLEACLQRKPLVEMNSASSPPLLDVRDFRVYYPIKRGVFQRTVDHVRAVDGVSFRLERGETLALVGESGCGKTTLGKALLNLVPSTSGEVLLDGVKISGQKVGARHEVQADLQIVFQDPYSSMNPRMLVGNILEEGLRAQRLRMTPAERRDKVEALLLAVGLPVSARGRYPHEFSGGQRQRLCIARALAVEPRLVICDEPTSALDVSVQAQVIRLLQELQDRHGLSYLFITHDLAVVSELADRVAVMHSGRIVETGKTRQVLFNPENDYTRRLLAALPKLHKSARTNF